MSIPQLLTLQCDNPNSIYLLPQGSFFHAYNEGALLLNDALRYKLRKGRHRKLKHTYTFCGFPISSFDKVITRLATYYANHSIGLEYFDTAYVLVLSE